MGVLAKLSVVPARDHSRCDPGRSFGRCSEPPFESLQQPVELLDIIAVETGPRRANGGAGDRASSTQNLFPDRKADADLLLVADQRKVAVENILGLLGLAGEERRADLHQHFRIGKAGHGAVRAAMELLRQIEPAIAAQDADPAPRLAVACAPDLLQLLQARPVLVR